MFLFFIPNEENPLMKKQIGRLVLAVLTASVLAGGAWLWWHHGRQEASSHQLVLHGNVDIRQVELAFNARERISGMFAEEGDRVRKGRLLATLETERLEAAVDAAEARWKAQKEIVARLEAGTRIQEIEKARAQVKSAAVEAENLQRKYERQRVLAARNVQDVQTADDARTAAEAAQARLQAAKEALQLAVEGPRQEDIDAAKATLQAYQAELKLARRGLKDAHLYAPSDGVIQERILEPGDMASPERPAYTLALDDPVWVRTYISETDLGRIQMGMAARVRTDSYPDKDYAAWIGFISPTAEFTPKTVQTEEVRTSLVYQVRVHVCNPQGELRLGMPATVILPLDPPPSEKSSPCGPPNG
jgi:HlyD family secretion protein